MTCGIYKISSPSGKFYIGSAKVFSKRWNQHRHLLRAGRHPNKPLQSAWKKYGEALIVFEKLIVCAVDDLLMFEQRAIDILRPAYNILRVAGRVSGYVHTEETRQKLSRAHSGRTLSKEQKRKISHGTKEFFAANPEIRERIRLVHVGKVTSEETKRKMGEKHRSNWESASTEKINAARERMTGENSPVAKLTWEIVRSIRFDFKSANGRRGIQKELCAKYNVSPASMCLIIKNKQWIEK